MGEEVEVLEDHPDLATHAAEMATLRERVAELERENGRLTERLALIAPPQPVEAPGGPQPGEPATAPPHGRWRALAPWLLTVLAIVALFMLAIRVRSRWGNQ